MIKVRYVGNDSADIRNGDIFSVSELHDDKRYYAVRDRSGEEYAYPKELFEPVVANE